MMAMIEEKILFLLIIKLKQIKLTEDCLSYSIVCGVNADSELEVDKF
jgi:hypothetical protein